MGGAICSQNGNADYTCQPLDYILTGKLSIAVFFVDGFIDANGSL